MNRRVKTKRAKRTSQKTEIEIKSHPTTFTVRELAGRKTQRLNTCHHLQDRSCLVL